MRISELQPGKCFEAGEEPPFYSGRLIRLGAGSAIVRYDVDREKTITVRRGRDVPQEVSFTAPTRPVAISLGTQVRPLDRPGCESFEQEAPACEVSPSSQPNEEVA